MRTLVILLSVAILSFSALPSYSQTETKTEIKKEVKLSSLSLSSGEGPLSNGVFAEVNFSRGNDVINASISASDMYFVYLKGIGKRISIGPSFEYFLNVPVLGIMGFITPVQTEKFSIVSMTWSGISAGVPGEKVEPFNWGYRFFWQSLDFTYSRFTMTGAILNYDTWGPLVDFKYKQPLTPKWNLFASTGYSWYGDGKALLKLGITYKP